MSEIRYEIETPKGRRRASNYHFWVDHGFLRYAWSNFDEVAPGVYRSNHPTRARFQTYAAQGIRSILTLRGGKTWPHHLLEVEACDALGLSLHCVPMSARHAPTVAQLTDVFTTLDQIERPFLMHCKSGADRTGLVSALYLLSYENTPIEVAQKQLSLRYFHLKQTRTGILDAFLETYATQTRNTGLDIRTWISEHYDPAALTEAFEQA